MSFGTCYWTQIFATVIVCLSAVSDGIHLSWMSPIAPILLHPDSSIAVNRSNVNLLELIYYIGGIAGLPFTMWSVDRWGSKRTIIMAAISNCVVWLMILLATNVYILYVARFLAGCNSHMLFVSIPMYISEKADRRIRGFLVAQIGTMLLTGCVICYSVAPFVSIATTSLVGLSFVSIQLLVFPWLPETPYYHLLRNEDEKASRALQFFRRRGPEGVEEELEELRMAVHRQAQESGHFRDMFTVGSNRRGLIIMAALTLTHNLSGNTIILMKLHTMFAENQFLSENNIAIVDSLIMLTFCLASTTVVDRFGRKLLLSFSSVTTALALIVFAGYTSLHVQNADWVPIAAVFTLAAVYRMGLGSVPIVVCGEVFPTSVKAMAMTMADSMDLIFGTLVLYVFQLLDERFGMQVPFFLYAFGILGMAIFIHFYLPETKGKTLEHIQLMLKGVSSSGDNNLRNMTFMRTLVQRPPGSSSVHLEND